MPAPADSNTQGVFLTTASVPSRVLGQHVLRIASALLGAASLKGLPKTPDARLRCFEPRPTYRSPCLSFRKSSRQPLTGTIGGMDSSSRSCTHMNLLSRLLARIKRQPSEKSAPTQLHTSWWSSLGSVARDALADNGVRERTCKSLADELHAPTYHVCTPRRRYLMSVLGVHKLLASLMKLPPPILLSLPTGGDTRAAQLAGPPPSLFSLTSASDSLALSGNPEKPSRNCRSRRGPGGRSASRSHVSALLRQSCRSSGNCEELLHLATVSVFAQDTSREVSTPRQKRMTENHDKLAFLKGLLPTK